MSGRPEILREYRAKFAPASEVEPVGIEELGLRTKFGGAPDEIQAGGQSRIVCSSCRKRMYFSAQIDSFECKGEENPNAKDHGDVNFMFGDVGMICVWFCFDCLEPLATMDCY